MGRIRIRIAREKTVVLLRTRTAHSTAATDNVAVALGDGFPPVKGPDAHRSTGWNALHAKDSGAPLSPACCVDVTYLKLS